MAAFFPVVFFFILEFNIVGVAILKRKTKFRMFQFDETISKLKELSLPVDHEHFRRHKKEGCVAGGVFELIPPPPPMRGGARGLASGRFPRRSMWLGSLT